MARLSPGWRLRWHSLRVLGRGRLVRGLRRAAGPNLGAACVGAAAAVTAGAGLLGITGRWRRQTPFWVPAALTWVCSGAMAAFDGLIILLCLVLPPDGAGAGWRLTDTILVIKVVVGVLAGAVGALAVAAAAEDLRLQ